jgi:hypothetical protein
MRKLSVLVAVVLMVTSGCNKASMEVQGEGGKALGLTVSPKAIGLTQGQKAQVTVQVKRTNFDDPVKLDFSQLPKGVTIVEDTRTIDKGSTQATFTLKAEEKAPAESGHVAKVAAEAAGMKAGPLEIKVNVLEKPGAPEKKTPMPK